MSIYFIYALNIFNSSTVTAGQIVLSLYALKLGASPFQIGLLAGSFSIFPMLLAVTAGRLVDRYGCRWPMTFGIACAATSMITPYLFHGLTAIYVASTVGGLAIIFYSLSIQNLIGLLSTPETRARYFGNYTLTSSVGALVGPFSVGFAIDHAGHEQTFLYLALLTLIPIVALLLRGGGLPGGTRRSVKSGGGMRAMLAQPGVVQLLIVGSLVNTGINLYQFYMPVYAHSLGLSASAIGMVLAMNSAAAFIARFGLSQLINWLGQARLLSYTFFLGAASLILIPVVHHPALLALLSFTFGLGMGCGQPIVIMMMFSNSKDGRSGEALGLKFTTNQLTKLVSPIVFGAIASALGLLPMFWMNAMLMVYGGVVSRDKKQNQ